MTNQSNSAAPSDQRLSWLTALTSAPSLTQSEWSALHPLVQWLIMVRSVVLVMTVSAGGLGVALAYRIGQPDILEVVALLCALTLAHATNNLVNDWVDFKRGTDDDNYFRRRYGAHVLADGLMGSGQYALILLATGALALITGLTLVWNADTATIALFGTGVFFVLFYTWPLKQLALGELAVFLVWGPLMVLGTCYTLIGAVSLEGWLVSTMAGLGASLVILGKHLDKLPDDTRRAQRSLPTIIGETNTRRLLCSMTVGLLALAVIVTLTSSPSYLLLLLAIPAGISMTKCLANPVPPEPPASYPAEVWPLWFTAHGFRFNRDFSLTLLLSLVLSLWFQG